jgi:hypothetical protein
MVDTKNWELCLVRNCHVAQYIHVLNVNDLACTCYCLYVKVLFNDTVLLLLKQYDEIIISKVKIKKHWCRHLHNLVFIIYLY